MTYNAIVCRITNVKKLDGSDFLQTGTVMFNPVVVGLDVKENDLGIYFPDDGRLSEEYCKQNNLYRDSSKNADTTKKGLFDENRKVRTQKIRKAMSVGYFAPIDSIFYTKTYPSEGTIFTELRGHPICEKYVSSKTLAQGAQKGTSKSKSSSRVTHPFFYKHRDTEQLAYNTMHIAEGDMLIITEKVHGTSGRTAHTIELSYSPFASWINNLLHFNLFSPNKSYKVLSGTRNTTITNFDNHIGFFKTKEQYRYDAHLMFKDVLAPGEAVYYEIVGYDGDGLIQPAADNNKTKDKNFIKRYGKSTKFTYGCEHGKSDVYVYRLTKILDDGTEVDYSWEEVQSWCSKNGFKFVPVLFMCKYNGDAEKLMNTVESLIDRESTLDSTHLMEGAVVRINKPGWHVFKHKSFFFKVLEDIIKIDDVADTEESS